MFLQLVLSVISFVNLDFQYFYKGIGIEVVTADGRVICKAGLIGGIIVIGTVVTVGGRVIGKAGLTGGEKVIGTVVTAGGRVIGKAGLTGGEVIGTEVVDVGGRVIGKARLSLTGVKENLADNEAIGKFGSGRSIGFPLFKVTVGSLLLIDRAF